MTLFYATISLLIFCLEDLSILDSVVLKSPTIIVLLSISFLKSSKIFFMYVGAPMLGAYIFTMFMSSWWILPLSIMQWPSGSLFMDLLLKSILSDMSIATPALFLLSNWVEYFFQHFTSVSIGRVFWGGSLVGSISVGHVFLTIQLFCVFWLGRLIHLRLRLLLVGTYSLSIFHTCVPLSFTVFLSLLTANSLASLAELVWWRYILLDFFCLGNSLFSFHLDWEPCWGK